MSKKSVNSETDSIQIQKTKELNTISTRSTKTSTTEESGFQICECPLIVELIWPLTILTILLLFYSKLKHLIDNISRRISEGSSISVSPTGISIGSCNASNIKSQENKHQEIPKIDFIMNREIEVNILSTLLIQQTILDPSFSIRWTFRITSSADFDKAIGNLQALGLVAIDQNSNQYLLTDSGYKFCKENKDSLGSFSYFPVK